MHRTIQNYHDFFVNLALLSQFTGVLPLLFATYVLYDTSNIIFSFCRSQLCERWSPDPFSRAVRSGVFIIYSYLQATWATCKQLQVAIIVHYRAGSHYHRRGSSFRSDSGMFALRQSILESQIPVFSFWNPVCQRFLFGWLLRKDLR